MDGRMDGWILLELLPVYTATSNVAICCREFGILVPNSASFITKGRVNVSAIVSEDGIVEIG